MDDGINTSDITRKTTNYSFNSKEKNEVQDPSKANEFTDESNLNKILENFGNKFFSH